MGALLTLSASRMVPGRTDLSAPTAATAEPLLAFELDRLFRSDRTPPNPGTIRDTSPSGEDHYNRRGTAGMEQGDRAYLIRSVQARTGLPQPDAARRVIK